MTKSWASALKNRPGPIYLAFVHALDEAIRSGELPPGTRLDPQRDIARELGVDLTTVSRAMNEARKRGLVVARGRAGSFVAFPRREAQAHTDAMNLSINYPPPLSESLQQDLRETFARIAREVSGDVLFDYPRRGWQRRHLTAGAEWCALVGLSVDLARITLAGGAQQALVGITAMLCKAGDAIVADGLTYPGMMAIAQRMGVRVVGVEQDEDGMSPESLDDTCRRVRPKFIYLTPTFHNPTTCTLPLERRRRIAAIAETHNVQIVEDDSHGALRQPYLASIASLAGHRTYYVTSMSKTVSAGLRTAFIAAPSANVAATLSNALIALGQFPAPFVAEATTAWITSGKAVECTRCMRSSAEARWRIAREMLPGLIAGDSFTNHFGWLPLPGQMRGESFAERAGELGVRVAPAAAFATSPRFNASAVRVCIGAADMAELPEALKVLALVLTEDRSLVRPLL